MRDGIDRTGELPVFKQICDILRAEIQEGRYDAEGKLPSEKALCLRFDVERNTVRKALQILVDENRIARVPGVGTRILSAADTAAAQNTGPGRKDGNIVILITQVDYLGSAGGESFHYKLIHSLERRFSALGYNLLFKPVDQEGVVTETIRSAAPRGIIFDSLNRDSFYLEAAASGLPCVSINHHTPLLTSIVSDNFGGAEEAARRFADAGHSRIACIMGKDSHQTSRERLNGVRTLCAERGIPLQDECLIPGDWTFSSGEEAAKKILAMKASRRPTAVFAFNDDLAYGCYSVLQSQGLSVPGDISLAGFDKSDRYLAVFPPITTVDVNLEAMVDYVCWYLGSCLSGWVPKGRARIRIDTTFRDNGTIKNIT